MKHRTLFRQWAFGTRIFLRLPTKKFAICCSNPRSGFLHENRSLKMSSTLTHEARHMKVVAGSARLEGDLHIPERARGIVLFAHGSGSSRHSPRNRFVAAELQERRLATLLIDLMTRDEEAIDRQT